MIELIPAIDIIDGQCVRLTKGDYNQKTVYHNRPADVAADFEKLGFKRLHVVDLDGAKSKHIVNKEALQDITTETQLTVDFGGGIKTDDDIEKAFRHGASMVTVGSIAVTNPELFISWLEKYGAERMILGADVRNGMISINGWKEDSAERCFPSSNATSTQASNTYYVQRSQKTEHYKGLPLTFIVRSWRLTPNCISSQAEEYPHSTTSKHSTLQESLPWSLEKPSTKDVST